MAYTDIPLNVNGHIVEIQVITIEPRYINPP